MVRRLLTKELIDELVPPKSGEIWIADTIVRGFGIRLWTSGETSGAAFCIRVLDKNSRLVRKHFDQRGNRGWHFATNLRTGQYVRDENGFVSLSIYLEDARDWAKEEIDRIKGRLPPPEAEIAAAREYQEMRASARRRIEKLTLGYLVENVLSGGSCRGWSEAYCDRLRSAFYAFDSSGSVADRTIGELEGGVLMNLIQESGIGKGNLRHLRSLLNVVFWNIHEVGGPSFGRMVTRRAWQVFPKTDEQELFLQGIGDEEYQQLLQKIRELRFDWRSTICIEMCLYFWAPVRRIMRGRWLQLVEDAWFPYAPNERKNWALKYDRIDRKKFACLKRARECAEKEGVVSEFWFPSRTDPRRPVTNIDRAWRALLEQLRWPYLPLNRLALDFRQKSPIDTSLDPDTRLRISREVARWNKTMS